MRTYPKPDAIVLFLKKLLVNLKRGISLVIFRYFLCLFQGFCGFGRDRKSLVILRSSLNKKTQKKKTKEKKGRDWYLLKSIAGTNLGHDMGWCKTYGGRKMYQRTRPPEKIWTPPKQLLVCSVVDFCTGKNRATTPEGGGKRTV